MMVANYEQQTDLLRRAQEQVAHGNRITQLRAVRRHYNDMAQVISGTALIETSEDAEMVRRDLIEFIGTRIAQTERKLDEMIMENA